MNVELLRKIAAVIQEKPEKFDICGYHTKHKCGTAHCIGGWAEVLSKKPLTFNFRQPMKLLRLETQEAFRLFHPSRWPELFDSNDATSSAARIEHFIKTNGAE